MVQTLLIDASRNFACAAARFAQSTRDESNLRRGEPAAQTSAK